MFETLLLFNHFFAGQETVKSLATTETVILIEEIGATIEGIFGIEIITPEMTDDMEENITMTVDMEILTTEMIILGPQEEAVMIGEVVILILAHLIGIHHSQMQVIMLYLFFYTSMI